jgi:hypothetical protein
LNCIALFLKGHADEPSLFRPAMPSRPDADGQQSYTLAQSGTIPKRLTSPRPLSVSSGPE